MPSFTKKSLPFVLLAAHALASPLLFRDTCDIDGTPYPKDKVCSMFSTTDLRQMLGQCSGKVIQDASECCNSSAHSISYNKSLPTMTFDKVIQVNKPVNKLVQVSVDGNPVTVDGLLSTATSTKGKAIPPEDEISAEKSIAKPATGTAYEKSGSLSSKCSSKTASSRDKATTSSEMNGQRTASTHKSSNTEKSTTDSDEKKDDSDPKSSTNKTSSTPSPKSTVEKSDSKTDSEKSTSKTSSTPESTTEKKTGSSEKGGQKFNSESNEDPNKECDGCVVADIL